MGRHGKIGSQWRVAAHEPELEIKNKGVFDELVLEHAVHIEQMNRNQWWMGLGAAHVWIDIGQDGYPTKITITEGVERIHRDGHIELKCK